MKKIAIIALFCLLGFLLKQNNYAQTTIANNTETSVANAFIATYSIQPVNSQTNNFYELPVTLNIQAYPAIQKKTNGNGNNVFCKNKYVFTKTLLLLLSDNTQGATKKYMPSKDYFVLSLRHIII